MEIRVSGHQVDTGEALKLHVQQRLNAIADKYFERAISANVTFGKGPHDHAFTCDIVAHVMQGVILKGSGQAAEAHPAFDQAADRIEKQLRRYMGRLKDRHGATPVDLDRSGGGSAAATPRRARRLRHSRWSRGRSGWLAGRGGGSWCSVARRWRACSPGARTTMTPPRPPARRPRARAHR